MQAFMALFKAGATVATTAPPVASAGFSLAGLLQGGATVLGIVSKFAAGAAEADRAEADALDAQRERALERLQGIDRRTSIRAQLAEAIGAQGVAYASSGLDLTFGTASQARADAFREADLALTTDANTEQVRDSRLVERAANYRSAAKRARMGGVLDGLAYGAESFARIKGRY